MASSSLYCLCLALCILQAAIGEARPDFGTTQTFPSTEDVRRLAADIGLLVNLLGVGLEPPVPLGGLADDYLPFLQELAAKIITPGTNLAFNLSRLATSSSNKDTLFANLNNDFNNLLSVFLEVPELWPETLDGLFGMQLYESLELAFQAASDVKDILVRLYGQLSPASSEEVFDSSVFPLLEQALTLLEARLNFLSYVFSRAGSNINEASIYYNTYQGYANNITSAFGAASDNYDRDLTARSLSIKNEFVPVKSAYEQENDELQAGLVGPITDAQSYPALVSALSKFRTNGTAALVTLTETDLPTAINASIGDVAFVLLNVFDELGLYPIEKAIADNLVYSDADAELCYHLVEAQSKEVPLQAPIRVQECFDRERPRLCRMHELAIELASLQIADIQDIWEQLETCTRLRHRNPRNKCVRHFATIFDALGTAHLKKYEDFMQLIKQTLESSTIRLSICLGNIDFLAFGSVLPRLLESLITCTGCVGSACLSPYEISGEESLAL